MIHCAKPERRLSLACAGGAAGTMLRTPSALIFQTLRVRHPTLYNAGGTDFGPFPHV